MFSKFSAVRARLFYFMAMTLFMLAIITPANGQEFRGSITGQVLDSSGGVVPGAQVSIKNLATNTSTSTSTNDEGNYTLLYLTPGMYEVTVEANGYKKLIRQGVEVRVGDKLSLNLALEVGEMQATVNVTSEAPLLQTSTASVGQVIDRRRISELPLSDGNPFTLARLATGAAYTGELTFSRPFDNQGTSAIHVNGAPGRNEFTLDGTPNMASGGGQGGVGRVAFVPPADAVQEFKVETATFDAQQGHTAGGNVNVLLKTGTNKFHGTLYEFVRNDKLSANDFFLNRANRPRSALRYNRYGFTVGGPVILPRFGEGGKWFWTGRDKTFFFFAFESLPDVFPEPDLFTVPTQAQRNGDLSAFLGAPLTTRIGANSCTGLPAGTVVTLTNRDGSPVRAGQIYDPLTGQSVTRCNPITGNNETHVERLPFIGNIIPLGRISPIARNYLQFYPLPNVQGDAFGRNNFISAQPRTDDFHSESVRIDHTFTENNKGFFRYTHNNRKENRGNWAGIVNGINPTGNFLFRVNNGVTYDHVYTASATTSLNVRAGFTRFWEPNVRQHEGAFSPASLGFSARTASFFGDASYLPRFEFPGGTFSNIGNDMGAASSFNIYSFQPTVTKLFGNHTLRIGYDFRSYRENGRPARHAAGRYDFNNNFTRLLDNTQVDPSIGASIGQPLAAFLVGQPTGGFIDRSAQRSNQTLYHGVFFHNDWKVTNKLTLNLGVRYELEGATTERYNRNVRGFDSTTSNPIEAQARAAYAISPIPQVPVDSFRVKGGLLFADDSNRGFWNADKNNIQPRIGFAYRLNDKTVIRGGWAIYTVPYVIDGVQQPGFSQSTNIVPSADNGRNFQATLFEPFPFGVDEPPGSSLGLRTFIGRDIEFVPVDRNNAQAQRWVFSLQRELPGNWLIELSYVGTRGYDITTTTDILNAVPRQYLSTSKTRDNTTISFLTGNVTNPFRNLAPGTNLNNQTVQRQQLLRPFPHFGRIRTRRHDGSSTFHSGQLRAEKRFSNGYTLLVGYTWSKFIEEVDFLNETDTEYQKVIAADDVPHRIVVSGIYELPFGRGRRIGNSWSGVPNVLLGGWQVQGIWQYQSGRPLGWGNVFFNGDPTTLRTNISGATVNRTFDTSGFFVPGDANAHRLANNVRYFPLRMSSFRGQEYTETHFSVIKKILFTESTYIELRGEFINLFNHPQFNNPNLDPTNSNFGRSLSMANLPRNVQLGIKFVF